MVRAVSYTAPKRSTELCLLEMYDETSYAVKKKTRKMRILELELKHPDTEDKYDVEKISKNCFWKNSSV